MMKILFVCHGNICRSPMAEYVMKDLVEKAGKADEYEIDSAAVSREEIGNGVYPPARRELEKAFPEGSFDRNALEQELGATLYEEAQRQRAESMNTTVEDDDL